MFEIFQYDFMVRAFLAGTTVALIAPMIGLFLVVRRYSYMADTLAHVSLVGVALGVLAGVNPILPAIGVATLASLGIEKLRENKRLFGESILALFLSGSLALAVVLMSLSKGFQGDLVSYLFGSITTVSALDVVIIVALAAVVCIFIFFFYRQLFLVTFHEELAFAEGLNTKAFNTFLIIAGAIIVSLSMRIVGTLLIGALMVIPVVSALQLKKSFAKTFIFSVIFSLFSTWIGLFVSFYLNLASGGTIVLVALCFFLVSFFFSSHSSSTT